MRLQQIAKRDGRHADGIDGEEEETRIGVEQLATIGDQAGQIFLQPPHLAIGPAVDRIQASVLDEVVARSNYYASNGCAR